MENKQNINALFEEYWKTKDIDLRNKIVEHFLPLVEILASKYANRGIDWEDLAQTGNIALILSVERFDPTKGYKFESFATPTIIGEIKRYFRDKGWMLKVPRQLKDIAVQLSGAHDELIHRLKRKPTVKEVADYLGYSEEKILEAMESTQAFDTVSLNQTIESDSFDESNISTEQFLGVEEQGFANFENAAVINKVIDTMTDREKRIFSYRIINGGSQKALAAELGMSQMQVSRIEGKIREKFRKEFQR
jgi:RNA polymerase sigma-B factor